MTSSVELDPLELKRKTLRLIKFVWKQIWLFLYTKFPLIIFFYIFFIYTSTGNSPSVTTSSPHMDTHTPSQMSGKIPVQDPKSPLQDVAPTFNLRKPKLAPQDARSPTQVTSDGEKSLDLGESPGNETEGLSASKPLQETANSAVKTKSTVQEDVRPTQETVSPSTGHTEESDQDKSKSLQETGEPSQRQEAEVENTEEIQTGHDVSSVDNPDVKRPKQETVNSEANSDSLKEEAVPTQETMVAAKGPFEESGLEVGVKAHPTDEVRDVPPAGNPESIQPKQETASSDKECDSLNEEVVLTQETMAAGKGPFEESGLEVGVKAHPTDRVRGVPPAGNPESIQLKQETASSYKESASSNEEVVPTQETMEAGKGPFEETGLEVGVKSHPMDEVHDVPPAENSESIQPRQETASSEKESDSFNEEAVSTQETMASGKGPLEESGIEVGVKAHPTDQRE